MSKTENASTNLSGGPKMKTSQKLWILWAATFIVALFLLLFVASLAITVVFFLASFVLLVAAIGTSPVIEEQKTSEGPIIEESPTVQDS